MAEKDLQDACQRAEELRRQHFQTGEIKSSKVRAKDADRRVRKGYKIPQTRADINDFLEMASGVVVPLLERVKKAREVYKLSSRGEYDIIKASRLMDLERLLSSLDTLAPGR